MNNALSPIHSTVPVISTDNIRKSVDYYVKVLGFMPDFEFGDPVVYAGVKSGEAGIYFSYDPDFSEVIREKHIHPEIFVWLTDGERMYNLHVANGAEIIEPISERIWGSRQYVVRDVNGYHLKFAQPL